MRIVHFLVCLFLGVLGIHRFIVGQKRHGLVFLFLSVLIVLSALQPATSSWTGILAIPLGFLILMDLIFVLLTGRYVLLSRAETDAANVEIMQPDKTLELDDFLDEDEFLTVSGSCTLIITGNGFEFSATRLNAEEVDLMRKFCEEDLDEFTVGGRFTENSNVGHVGEIISPTYGIDPFDAELHWDDYPDEDEVYIREANFHLSESITDPIPQTETVDFFCVAGGKIFGSVEVPISHPSEFEPEKFQIEYLEFELDGYPEMYGRVITRLTYDGEEMEIECEDNGLDVNTFLLGYELDNDDELIDYLVVHENRGGENFEFNWTMLENIFKSKDQPN